MTFWKLGMAAALAMLLATGVHAGAIQLQNAGFDDDPSNTGGAWSTVSWETVGDGIGPQAGTYFFNLLQGDSSGNSNWLLQASNHTIAAGETYSLGYYVAPRAQVYADNPGYMVDVVGHLYDITANAPIASLTTTRESMVANWKGVDNSASWLQQTLTYTIPEASLAIGHVLGVVFTPTGGSSWACQTCLDSVSLTAVPEPSSLVLVSMGVFGLLAYAWRKRR